MNEKEIAKEIMRQQWGCEGAIWKALPLEIVQEWGETISYWLEIANMRAAHAIAKKLAEGVVWDKVLLIDRSPFDRNELAGWSDEGDGDYQVYFVGDHGEIEEGNEYRVTVTKEE